MTRQPATDPRQEAFLTNLAAKLGRPRRSGVTPPVREQKPYAHLYEGLGHDDLVRMFIATLQTLHTEVDHVARTDFAAALQRAVTKFGIKSALLWDDPRLHELGAGEWLEQNGVETRVWTVKENRTGGRSAQETQASVPSEKTEITVEQAQPDNRMSNGTANAASGLRSYAARADMGITYAELGLAETGTVLLLNGGGRGRVVSLLPPVYLVVLDEADITRRLTDGVARVKERLPEGLPSCINFISGPSRTGDIEMDLAFGVHGPGQVHVILLHD